MNKIIKTIILLIIGMFFLCSCQMETTIEPEKKLNQVVIKTLPSKTVFYIGDTFSCNGLSLEAYYADATTEVFFENEYEIVEPVIGTKLESATENLRVKVVAFGQEIFFSVIVREKSSASQGGTSGSGSSDNNTDNPGSNNTDNPGDSNTDEPAQFIYEIDAESQSCVIKGIEGYTKNLVIPHTLENVPVKRIESFAFMNCEFIETVTFPEGLEELGTQAFYNCTGIKELVFPESLSLVETEVFHQCSGLRKIIVNSKELHGDSINIESVFNGGSVNLDYLEFTEKVQKIPAGPWIGVRAKELHIDYPSIKLEDNSIYIVDFEILSINTNIPNGGLFNGYRGGFQNIQKIILGNDITHIGNNAFANPDTDYIYSKFRTLVIEIPDSVVYIGDDAFEATKVKNIPKNIKHIGTRAFGSVYKSNSDIYLGGIESNEIVLPETLEYIGENAFSHEDYDYSYNESEILHAKKYKSLVVNCNIPEIIQDTLSYSSNEIFSFVHFENIQIGENVTSIGGFKNSEIDNITIPEGVTTIGNEAFSDCTGLTSMTIPSSVKAIGTMVCDGTETLILDNVKEIDVGTGGCFPSVTKIIIKGEIPILKFEDSYSDGIRDFLYGYSIPESVEVELDSKTTVIPDKFFYMVETLKNITIPDSVTTIGKSAFSDCTGLTNVTIPEGVTTIGSYAFSDCTSLTNVIIPEGVTTIGSYAFSDCTSLTNVIIPDSVTSIDVYAFSGCTSLKEATLGIGCKIISVDMFADCTSLEKVNIPDDNLIAVGDYAFKRTKLKEFHCGKNLTYFGKSVFEECNSLEVITGISGSKTITPHNEYDENDKRMLIDFLGYLPKMKSISINEEIVENYISADSKPQLEIICFEENVKSIEWSYVEGNDIWASNDNHYKNIFENLNTVVFKSVIPPKVYPLFLGMQFYTKIEEGTLKAYVPDESLEVYNYILGDYFLPLSQLPEDRSALL